MEKITENILTAKIQLVVNTMDEIESILNRAPEEQSRCDSTRSDYLHIIENTELNNGQMINVTKKIHDICVERRIWNNIAIIGKTYREHVGKLVFEKQRPFFRQMMSNTIGNLNKEYKDRVLTKEEKEVLLNTTVLEEPKQPSKSTYYRATNEEILKVVEELKKGKTPKELALKYGLKTPTIYHWKKIYIDGE